MKCDQCGKEITNDDLRIVNGREFKNFRAEFIESKGVWAKYHKECGK